METETHNSRSNFDSLFGVFALRPEVHEATVIEEAQLFFCVQRMAGWFLFNGLLILLGLCQ